MDELQENGNSDLVNIERYVRRGKRRHSREKVDQLTVKPSFTAHRRAKPDELANARFF